MDGSNWCHPISVGPSPQSPGGITQLRDYVPQIRPRREPEPSVRMETPPGHQATLDFAACWFPWGKRIALLVDFGYSRLLWLLFCPRHLGCRIRASRPHRAQTKGKREGPIGYVRGKLLYGP